MRAIELTKNVYAEIDAEQVTLIVHGPRMKKKVLLYLSAGELERMAKALALEKEEKVIDTAPASV